LLIGAVGGLVAARRQKVRRRDFWWRVLVGSVTGSALYMAGIAGILSDVIGDMALTMFGLILLALLGGFLGTEVFTLLLKRLGLIPEEDQRAKTPKRIAP
jgi:uncharacterized membrane protein YhaH (DUF805 family)